MHSRATSGASSRGLGLVVLAAVLWGTVGVATQALYKVVDTTATSIGFFRLILASPALVVACWRLLGRSALRIRPLDLLVMILLGVMLALYQVGYFEAIRYTGVAVAAFVTLCTAPVLVAVLSVVITRERLTRTVILSLTLALCGTALLVGLGSGVGPQRLSIYGMVVALVAALGYALFTLGARTLAGRYHPLQVSMVCFAIGAVLLYLVSAPRGMVVHYPPHGWLLLLYLGVVPTAFAYGIFLAGMRTTPATVASIVTLLEPLVAAGLAWAVFGEQLEPKGGLGALLLLGAVGLLYRNRHASG